MSMQKESTMTEISITYEKVSNEFIKIYRVLDNELQRSDVFIPFLNSMLKLQASASNTDNFNTLSTDSLKKALNNLIIFELQVKSIADIKILPHEQTQPMLDLCQALRLYIENYLSQASV